MMQHSLKLWSGKAAVFAPMRAGFCSVANDLIRGTCKWFDSQKGFGFITIDNEERDVLGRVAKVRGALGARCRSPRWHCRCRWRG